MSAAKENNNGFNDASNLNVLNLWRGEAGKADINCDLGEGAGNDDDIMPYITSANIACGYHAGDSETMWRTVESAIRHKVAIGAHPSFFDRKNFGRSEMNLDPGEIYDLVTQQLLVRTEI